MTIGKMWRSGGKATANIASIKMTTKGSIETGKAIDGREIRRESAATVIGTDQRTKPTIGLGRGTTTAATGIIDRTARGDGIGIRRMRLWIEGCLVMSDDSCAKVCWRLCVGIYVFGLWGLGY